MKDKLVIDPEFTGRLMPHQPEELAQLRENLIESGGARDKLVVWQHGGKLILLDGHTRKKICDELNLPYSLEKVELADREEAADWIDRNQMGRRNLTIDQQAILRGRRYNRTKKNQAGTGANQHKQSVQNAHSAKTSATLAAEHGVHEQTIRRDGQFAEAVEKLGIEQEVIAGEFKRTTDQRKVTRKAIVEAAQALPETPTPKQVEEVVKAIKDDRPIITKQEALPGMGESRPILSKAQLRALPPRTGKATARRALRVLADIQDHDAELMDAVTMLREWCNDKENKASK